MLEQNFPNPFNPTTTISFTIPRRTFATLRIFDILGREVATLLREELPAGNYSRIWDDRAFPSGVYLYDLQCESFHMMKKLLLLK